VQVLCRATPLRTPRASFDAQDSPVRLPDRYTVPSAARRDVGLEAETEALPEGRRFGKVNFAVGETSQPQLGARYGAVRSSSRSLDEILDRYPSRSRDGRLISRYHVAHQRDSYTTSEHAAFRITARRQFTLTAAGKFWKISVLFLSVTDSPRDGTESLNTMAHAYAISTTAAGGSSQRSCHPREYPRRQSLTSCTTIHMCDPSRDVEH
jgi:hypothetical protein